MTNKDANGNTTMDFPITKVENVEGAASLENLETNYLPLSGGIMTGELCSKCIKVLSADDSVIGGQINFDSPDLSIYPRSYIDNYAGFFRIVQVNNSNNVVSNFSMDEKGVYYNENLIGLYTDMFCWKFGAEGVSIPEGGTWMGLIMYVTNNGEYTTIGDSVIAGGSALYPPSGYGVGVVILKRVK